MQIPDGWTMEHDKLVRHYTFSSFDDTVRFLDHVFAVAAKLNHHPEIHNSYTRVTLTLSTHDLPALPDGREQAGAGDIATDKDITLAQAIDSAQQ